MLARLVPAAMFAASVALTILAVRVRGEREAGREMARIGLEDVSRRVALSVRNLRTVREMNEGVALSRARSLAQLISESPDVMKPENRAKFEAYAALLGVDELHVTDARGILVRCLPSVYEGRNMADSAQSAAFLPAITNAEFSLVQELQAKGLSSEGDEHAGLFQYAGVARRDEPGIVQVGYRAERVAEATRLADVDDIAATSRIGRDGRVRIERLEHPDPVPRNFRLEKQGGGRRMAVFTNSFDGYRVTVGVPESDGMLAGENAVEILAVADLFLLLLSVMMLPMSRYALARDMVTISSLFSSELGRMSSAWQMLRSPLTIAGTAVFVFMLAVFWIVSRTSGLRTAEETLRTAADDMEAELRDSVDSLLFFQGDAICRHYGTPEAMTADSVQEMLDRYGIDELNVVDGNGRVICGALAAGRYDMGSQAWTAEFNRLLHGAKTFSQKFRPPLDDPSGPRRKYAGVAFDPPAKGYLQLGLSEDRLKDRLDYFMKTIAERRHIGDTGYFVIAKADTGEIVSSGRNFGGQTTLASIGFDFTVADAAPYEAFEMTLGGSPCLCRSGTVNRYHRYVAAIPLSEVHGGARRMVTIASAVFFVLLVLVVLFTTRLSNLVTSLKVFIEKDREQREKDLSVARTIQASSLPPSFPDGRDWRIFARMIAAREVGGDFFDFTVMQSGRVFFMIADVSGKGIPAAMFMMKAKATIRACIYEFGDLSEAIAAANDRLSEQNDANMFVTAWFGLLDVASGEVECVNAGHNPPLVKRADGSVEWVRGARSLVLAAMPGAVYWMQTLHLGRGDTLFLYTDGVTEAMDPEGRLYGEERLETVLKNAKSEFVGAVRADVAAFARGAEQSDDITMLALELKNA